MNPWQKPHMTKNPHHKNPTDKNPADKNPTDKIPADNIPGDKNPKLRNSDKKKHISVYQFFKIIRTNFLTQYNGIEKVE